VRARICARAARQNKHVTKIAFFMDFLNVSTLSAHSARASARGQFWCAPMNFPDKIDEFWLLDHIFSSKTHKVHLG
tara:strand:- start:205 stop:432 length:228 start_codon:yes stop_codon:yes gene_type:complete